MDVPRVQYLWQVPFGSCYSTSRKLPPRPHPLLALITNEMGMEPIEKDEKYEAFLKELAALINRYSFENRSNTPDFILAEYLGGCLTVFDNITVKKEEWRGK